MLSDPAAEIWATSERYLDLARKHLFPRLALHFRHSQFVQELELFRIRLLFPTLTVSATLDLLLEIRRTRFLLQGVQRGVMKSPKLAIVRDVRLKKWEASFMSMKERLEQFLQQCSPVQREILQDKFLTIPIPSP